MALRLSCRQARTRTGNTGRHGAAKRITTPMENERCTNCGHGEDEHRCESERGDYGCCICECSDMFWPRPLVIDKETPRRVPRAPFWGKLDMTSLTRSLRLSVIQSQYDEGRLTEDQARFLLRGCLEKGDETTLYDDSTYLEVKDE